MVGTPLRAHIVQKGDTGEELPLLHVLIVLCGFDQDYYVRRGMLGLHYMTYAPLGTIAQTGR